MLAPLLKYISFSCHIMVLIHSGHNQLDGILVLLANELILILLSVNGDCKLLRIIVKFLSLKVLLEMKILYSLQLSLDFVLTIGDVCILDPVLEGTFYHVELGLFTMIGDFVQKALSQFGEKHKFFPFFKSSRLIDMVKACECSG
jgi:hypothetical protein